MSKTAINSSNEFAAGRAPAAIAARGSGQSGHRLMLATLLIGAVGLALVAYFFFFAPPRGSTMYRYRVINTFPHDNRAYSQGLAFDDGFIIEGTGQFGESTLRRVELETGRVVNRVDLPRAFFGEGVTVMGDKIYQLTWKNRTCIVYDRESLRELKRFQYDGEGWGLTHDGTHLIISDGSSQLRFIDPETFRTVRTLWVRNGGRAVSHLNELEYINGEIFANVWYEDYIVRIDPKTGSLTGIVDLTGLYPRNRRPDREAVLNGIAYDAKNERLFVTGKDWPALYEIEIVPAK